jgi:hypothetical protein
MATPFRTLNSVYAKEHITHYGRRYKPSRRHWFIPRLTQSAPFPTLESLSFTNCLWPRLETTKEPRPFAEAAQYFTAIAEATIKRHG